MIISKRHDISTGHLISGHPGKCKNMHGHNYRITFYVEGEIKPDGMVCDFDDIHMGLIWWLKDNWDHRFLVWDKDPAYDDLKKIDRTVVGTPFNPTAECMAKYLLDVVGPHHAPEGAKLVRVVVEETMKCSVSANNNE